MADQAQGRMTNGVRAYNGTTERQPGEGSTDAQYFFAAVYAACALLAFAASRAQGRGAATRTGPFWLRIAVLCAVFAVLRSFDANIVVSHAIRAFSHSDLAAAVAGLLLFRGRSLHPSVRGAAIVIILLVLLALAQSASLYEPIVILQATVGPATVSRIIEAALLIVLALCTIWFIRDPNGSEAVLLEE